MEKQKIAESILRTVKQEVIDFVNEESQITCPIEYEVRVIEIARKFATSLLSQSQGDLPKSRNSKKKS